MESEIFEQAKSQPEQFYKITAKKSLEMQDDLGMIPDTFIPPTGKNLPSFARDPWKRIKLELKRRKESLVGFGVLLAYRRTVKPPLKLELKKTVPTAVALHNQMYTAFTTGDTLQLSKICCSGLLTSFRARIAQRKERSEVAHWTLHKYTTEPKCVAHRGMVIPNPLAAEDEKYGVRQAVVRIESVQSLRRQKKDGTVVEGTGTERPVTEYIVIQRVMKKSEEEPWKVWGTTSETVV